MLFLSWLYSIWITRKYVSKVGVDIPFGISENFRSDEKDSTEKVKSFLFKDGVLALVQALVRRGEDEIRCPFGQVKSKQRNLNPISGGPCIVYRHSLSDCSPSLFSCLSVRDVSSLSTSSDQNCNMVKER